MQKIKSLALPHYHIQKVTQNGSVELLQIFPTQGSSQDVLGL